MGPSGGESASRVGSQGLHVLDQRVLVGRGEVGAVGMPGIAVAPDARPAVIRGAGVIDREAMSADLGDVRDKSGPRRLVDVVASMEDRRPPAERACLADRLRNLLRVRLPAPAEAELT